MSSNCYSKLLMPTPLWRRLRKYWLSPLHDLDFHVARRHARPRKNCSDGPKCIFTKLWGSMKNLKKPVCRNLFRLKNTKKTNFAKIHKKGCARHSISRTGFSGIHGLIFSYSFFRRHFGGRIFWNCSLTLLVMFEQFKDHLKMFWGSGRALSRQA